MALAMCGASLARSAAVKKCMLTSLLSDPRRNLSVPLHCDILTSSNPEKKRKPRMTLSQVVPVTLNHAFLLLNLPNKTKAVEAPA